MFLANCRNQERVVPWAFCFCSVDTTIGHQRLVSGCHMKFNVEVEYCWQIAEIQRASYPALFDFALKKVFRTKDSGVAVT